MKARELTITRDYAANEYIVQFRVDRTDTHELTALYDKWRSEWKQADLSVEMDRWRDKRSNDANAYAWVLMGKIAETLNRESHGETAYTKDDIYLLMLKRYGQGGIAKIKNEDIERWKRTWKYTEPHEKLADENAQYWRFWVGSSEYTTSEMSDFLNGVIADAKGIGIETMPPAEYERMMNAWQG